MALGNKELELPNKKPAGGGSDMSMREGIGRGLMSWGSGQDMMGGGGNELQPGQQASGAPPINPLQPEVPAAPIRPQQNSTMMGGTEGLHAGIPAVGNGSRFWSPVSPYGEDQKRKPLRRGPTLEY
jgi:hypothetical protein